MRIDWWTLGLQTINVLVLVWLLGRFLFRPIADQLAARRAEAAKLLDDAAAAKAAADADRAMAARELDARRAERDGAVAAARTEAEAAKAAVLAEARAEADRQRAAATDEIANRRAEAEAREADRAARLAVAIAGRLLARLPDGARLDGFVPDFLAALRDLPAETRAGLGRDQPLRLRVPRPLTEAERDDLAARLAEVLGHPVRLEETVEASLLAGLELETDHAVVRNSFAADLGRIETELTRHDRS